MSAERPLYRPYRWASAEFQLGLRPIRPHTWILIGPEHADRMRQKWDRLDRFQQFYYRALPESLPAQQELRRRVADHLLTDHPGSFERIGSRVRSRLTGRAMDLDNGTEPLLQLSYVIEEDFMLLEEGQGGEGPRIVAASNAYSSSGRLVASVGRGMPWAHEPVPRLTEKLGAKINRVIGSVHTTTPCERFNWQLTPMADVFFPHEDPHAANASAMRVALEEIERNPSRTGELLWIRVERQTLSRLPETNLVAFSLHTYSDPLSCIESDVESLQAILSLLNDYSGERWKYSEMDIVREPLMAWLRSTIAASQVRRSDIQ